MLLSLSFRKMSSLLFPRLCNVPQECLEGLGPRSKVTDDDAQ